MRKGLAVQIVWVLVVGTAFSACTQHVIAPDLRDRAVNAPAFVAVLENPEGYLGQMVIWGGIIIETVNEPGYTLIKVLQTPLEIGQMPGNGDYSQGRFIARATGYLDGAVYEKGRKVTVAGRITGKEVLPLSGIEYTYPVVSVAQIHLWPPAPAYNAPYYYRPYFWGWGWYGSCLSRPWGWGPDCLP
ncbi:Slp family lipoprotein [Desulfoferrobacter suflitae]|uniref:Slp family lipoprotein n=1 Tax=Desulfoferrobacter suflitae TaxID=2865782 RepID=UPI002164CB22|nr:Slp family lipoprotein [Desulfoferrobacter suflitae]MCK8602972.1 Slp family lipoprotein [Desulfoferrobacter suflitae]